MTKKGIKVVNINELRKHMLMLLNLFIQFEQERGHVASAVECFVKQHGVGEQEAEEELRKLVVDAWKDINEECLQPTAVPMQLLLRILNLTRVIDVLYTDKDNYTHAGTKLKSFVVSLLINPFPM